jgi:hypothetical protein
MKKQLPLASKHHPDCGWHFEQYPWECDCGAIVDPDEFLPEWLKGMVVPEQPESEKE